MTGIQKFINQRFHINSYLYSLSTPHIYTQSVSSPGNIHLYYIHDYLSKYIHHSLYKRKHLQSFWWLMSYFQIASFLLNFIWNMENLFWFKILIYSQTSHMSCSQYVSFIPKFFFYLMKILMNIENCFCSSEDLNQFILISEFIFFFFFNFMDTLMLRKNIHMRHLLKKC